MLKGLADKQYTCFNTDQSESVSHAIATFLLVDGRSWNAKKSIVPISALGTTGTCAAPTGQLVHAVFERRPGASEDTPSATFP